MLFLRLSGRCAETRAMRRVQIARELSEKQYNRGVVDIA